MCQPRTQGSVLPVPTERERTWERGCTCIWLNPRAGKVKRILCSDWLSERARSAHLAGPSCVGPARKMSLFGYFINPLLTKFVSSRWLNVGLFFFPFFVEWFYWEKFGVLNRWSLMEVNSTLFDIVWCTPHLCPTTVSYGTVYSPIPSPPFPREEDGCTATMKSFCMIQLFYPHLGTANATVILWWRFVFRFQLWRPRAVNWFER